MILTIGGIKGGTGKTTISVNLAVELAIRNKDVLLVDADDQGTATDFAALRNQQGENIESYTSIQLSGKSVREQVVKLKDKFDYIVIDTGGRDTTSQRAALSISDVLLVPLAPRSFDVWTLDLISALIEEVSAINPSLNAFAFLNRADVRGNENTIAQNIIAEKENIDVLPIFICNRKAFSDACAEGKAVSEHSKKDLKAVLEIQNLVKFTINYTS